MSNGAQIDFDALARKHGGAIDFDSLAVKHGGTSGSIEDDTLALVSPGGKRAPGVEMKEELAPKLVRSGTETLPAVGGVAGGIAASPTVAGAALGAGLGTGLGVEAKQLLNKALFGDGEQEPLSGKGLRELAVGMATSAATAGALQGTTNYLLNKGAQQAANQDWKALNEAVGATQKSVRIGRNAKDITQVSSMPGRGLANVGFSVESLNKLNPVERMAAISPHWRSAGKAIDLAVDEATTAGKVLDSGKSVYGVIKSIENPKLQEKALEEFSYLQRELGIANLRNSTPTETLALRRALKAGSRFGPNGDLNSLGGIRARLYGAVSDDLHSATPKLKELDQHYSDMESAMAAAQRTAGREMLKPQKPIETEPSRFKKFAKKVLPYLLPGAAAGAYAKWGKNIIE